MRRIYFALVSFCVVFNVSVHAQCPAGRFDTELFPVITMDSVVYSTPYNLKMDIYQPAGDTMAHRPVIILGHEGTFISGNRESDGTVDSLCARFARRGYVTASIDYRLSTFANMGSSDSTLPIDEVVKAISDGKAAIRYFVKDAATANAYKIDTNNIFVGGNSAGAVLYMHVGYLETIDECPSYIVAAMAANGGFEGNSGNSGYTTRCKALINLAGALNETSFIGEFDKPSVNAQGSNDNVVPYECGYPFAGLIHVNLCGLGSLEPVYTAKGVYHSSHVFPGDNHVPWDSDSVKFNTVDSLVKVFLYNMVCTGVAAVNTVTTNTELSLFPNPACEIVILHSSAVIRDIVVYDETGRTLRQVSDINKETCEVNTGLLSKGIYFMWVTFVDGNTTPVVKRLVIQ